jgi:uncharacterized damage-inducible protein DinB
MEEFDMTISITQLYDYHGWANHKLLTHLAEFPEAVLFEGVENSFPNVAETFGHIYTVDKTWLLRIRGEHVEKIEPTLFGSLEDLRGSFLQLHNEFRSYLALQPNCEKAVTYHNTSGKAFTNSIEEIVQHVVNHGTYHRGNIASILRQLGLVSVATDYVVYLREQE